MPPPHRIQLEPVIVPAPPRPRVIVLDEIRIEGQVPPAGHSTVRANILLDLQDQYGEFLRGHVVRVTFIWDSPRAAVARRSWTVPVPPSGQVVLESTDVPRSGQVEVVAMPYTFAHFTALEAGGYPPGALIGRCLLRPRPARRVRLTARRIGRDAQVSTSTGRSDGRTEGQSSGVELGGSGASVTGGATSGRAVTHTRERQRTETVVEGLARLELRQVE